MVQSARSCIPSHYRRAFSLTEMLVVLGIMSVMLALSVTVIHVANEFAKNLQHQVDSARLRVKHTHVRSSTTTPAFINDQYILMLRDDVNPHVEAGRLATVAPFELLEVYHSIYKGLAIKATPANLALLLRDSAVHYIEQDQLISVGAQTVPAGVRRIGADVPAAAASSPAVMTRREPRTIQIQFSNGTTWWFTLFHPRRKNHQPPAIAVPAPAPGDVDATIAIIDTGVAPHSDLNIVFEKGFGSLASTTSDRNGHGTHVAGTAAARNNELGVLGVAPGARIWALKVLDGPENGEASGSGKDVQAALDFVCSRAAQIDVVNLSLGTGGVAPSLDAAVERCVQAGVTVVVAAGNERRDASRYSPARAPNAITVAALDDTSRPGIADPGDKFASFSNHGAVVDLAAPGVNILSTWLRDGTRSLNGTSMAAPHVAGVAALIKAKNKSASPAMVLSRMQQAVIETIPGPGNRRYPVVNARPFAN